MKHEPFMCSSGFSGVRGTQSLVFCVMLFRSLCVDLSFFLCPLYCQSFFDLLLLITPFVSSSFLNTLRRLLNLW